MNLTRHHWFGAAVAAAVLSCSACTATVTSPSQADHPTTPLTISVDAPTPPGRDLEYTDYFPRDNVAVRKGGVVKFVWPTAPDDLHTVTLLKIGETPETAWDSTYVVPQKDEDDGPLQYQVNTAVFFPTFPSAPSNAPGACGTESAPCSYDGSRDVSSGAKTSNGSGFFYLRLDAPAGTAVSYIDILHRGMVGTLRVVSNSAEASTPSEVARAASAQIADDTRGAMAVITDLQARFPEAPVPDTTNSVTVVAGAAAPHVEILEYFPPRLNVARGTHVIFHSQAASEVHTVTFPKGTDEADPTPFLCETSHGDVLLHEGDPGCPNSPQFENHVNPFPVGKADLISPTQVSSSGLLGNPPLLSSYSFTMQQPGTFTYFCHLHGNEMIGSISSL